MKLKILISTGLILFALVRLYPQEKKLLTDKPGTFRMQVEMLNGQGMDTYGNYCAFSNREADAIQTNLLKLVAILRNDTVLDNIRGFDAICDLSAGRCNTKFGYGLPINVCLFFKTWSLLKGKEVQWVNEPPQFCFEVNTTDMFCSNGSFNVTDYSDAYNATNPDFTADKMGEATLALKELFFAPGGRESISPGIDRYGDNVVFFNPDRPPYWEQITIREVSRLMLDYYRLMPNKSDMQIMVRTLENEFSRFSEEEKDQYAYFGTSESVSMIGSKKNDIPVFRPNPAYWNKDLPRSEIQFMWLEIPRKNILKQKVESNLKAQDGYYFVHWMLDELNINSLQSVIAR